MTTEQEFMKSNEKTEHEWQEYLVRGQRNSATSLIDYCKRITEYKAKCGKVSGGSTFTADVKEWLGISHSVADRLCIIGDTHAQLSLISGKLPSTESTLYDLAMLTSDKVKEATKVDAFQAAIDADIIHPEMKCKVVKEFKAKLINDAMTDEQRKEKEAKDKVKQDAKDKAEKEKAASKPAELPEISDEEFKELVSEFIHPDHATRITESIGDGIPDPVQAMYLQAKGVIGKVIGDLTKANNRKVMRAVATIVTAQANAFDSEMKRMPKYHRIAEARLIKEANALKQKTNQLTIDHLVTPNGSMSTSEYKLILSCLHPDTNSSSERKGKAFAICNRVCG